MLRKMVCRVLVAVVVGANLLNVFTWSASAKDTLLLVEDGRPRAQIVIGEAPARLVTLAAQELRDYVRKLSGAELPIVNASEPEIPVRILIGRSAATDALGIDGDELKHGAFRMVTGPDYVVLLGHDFDYEPPALAPQRGILPPGSAEVIAAWDAATRAYTDIYWGFPLFDLRRNYHAESGTWFHDESGSLNAVYELLRMWGVRWYFPGEIGEVVPATATLAVPALDKTVTPDFKVRRFFGPQHLFSSLEDVLWIRRLGLNYGYPTLGSVGHTHGHRRMHAREEMMQQHPEYYALIGGERYLRGRGHVCYRSEGLIDETIRYVRAVFDLLDEPTVDLWPEDGFRMCECEKCAGKTPAEVIFPFVKRVAEAVYQTHPDRLITCGAYASYRLPPENFDRFPPNVAVSIAFQRPGLDDPESWGSMYGGILYEALMESWMRKVEPGNVLGVSNHFGGGGVVMPRSIAADLRFRKERSMGDWNEVGSRSRRKPGVAAGREVGRQAHRLGLHQVNQYVNARLLWDADQDLDVLLDEYYEKYYGPVADLMKAAIEMAENSYTRGQGRAMVPLEARLALIERMERAREKAGDTVYGRRIAYILEEEPASETLRTRLREQREAELARQQAPLVVATSPDREPNVYEMVDLQTGETPDERTTFTVQWDNGNLIFDIRCEDSDMENLLVSGNIWSGDSVAVLLETPSHTYYQIEVNPDGVLWDADREHGIINDNWSSLAEVETERGEDFWGVRIRFPVMDEAAGGLDPNHNVVGDMPTADNPWFIQVGRTRFRNFERAGAYGFTATGGNSYHVRERFGRLIVEATR